MAKYIILLTIICIIKYSTSAASIDSLLNIIQKASNTIDNSIQSLLTSQNEQNDITDKDPAVKQLLKKRKQIHDEFTLSSYKVSSSISQTKGIADKYFDRFLDSFLKTIDNDQKDTLKDHIKSIRNSEDNDWKCFDIIYNNKENNHVKFLSIYGSHEGTSSDIYSMEYESTITLNNANNQENNLLAISYSSAIEPEFKSRVQSMSDSLDKDEVFMLLALARKKAIKDFTKAYDKSKKEDI